jgi:mannose-6-phosphate isomerase-like protein (cupin superfamily)
MRSQSTDVNPVNTVQELLHLRSEYDYLAPDTAEVRLLCEMRGGGVAHCLVPPGHTTLAVTHAHLEEIWYFLSGKGQVWRKHGEHEEVSDVAAGTCVPIQPGVHFQIRNTGEEPLCFLMSTMPPWPGAHEARRVPDYWPVVPGGEASLVRSARNHPS